MSQMDFYHLNSHKFSALCSVFDSPDLIHIQSEHSTLSKLQKIAPSLSKLSMVDCESCQLGATFPHSPNNHAESFSFSSF